MALSQDEQLIVQSYLNCLLITSLQKNNFFQSDYFRKLDLGNSVVKKNLYDIGIDNQGMLLTFLYSMLVMPYERVFNNKKIRNLYKDEFKKLNEEIDKIAYEKESNYEEDKSIINYLYHIRNAISHGRVNFENRCVIFKDSKKVNKGVNKKKSKKSKKIKNKKYKCCIKFKLDSFWKVLIALQKFFDKYIEDINKRENNKS